jgi:hypothetical protein
MNLITRTHETLDGVTREAVYSPCEKYRYSLLIVWDPGRKPKCFIGLNPSTATELQDDPTIRRCIDYARRWNAGGLLMLNAFAYRATDPRDMLRFDGDKIGPANTVRHLEERIVLNNVGTPVAAWGRNAGKVLTPNFGSRAHELRVGMGPLDCLGLNDDGTPVHPLFQPKTATPIAFNYKWSCETRSLNARAL